MNQRHSVCVCPGPMCIVPILFVCNHVDEINKYIKMNGIGAFLQLQIIHSPHDFPTVILMLQFLL